MKILLGLFCFCGPSLCWATNITLDTTRADSSSSWTVSGSGDFPHQRKNDNVYGWDLSLGRTRTQSTSTTGTEVIDNSTNWSGGLSADLPRGWSFGGDYSISSTPEEQLTNMGPSIYFAYTHRFAPSVVKNKSEDGGDEESGFKPRLIFKMSASSQRYDQQFAAGGGVRRGPGSPLPSTGHNTIDQRSLGVVLKYKPWDWFQAKVSSTRYTYSRDVNEFLAFLDSQDKRTSSPGFNSALSGFSTSETGAELDFYFLENWEVDLASKTSKIESDGSLSRSYRLFAYWDFLQDWRLGLGSTRYVSDSSSSTESAFSLSYDF